MVLKPRRRVEAVGPRGGCERRPRGRCGDDDERRAARLSEYGNEPEGRCGDGAEAESDEEAVMGADGQR